MKNWTQLGDAAIPGGNQRLRLYAGKDDYFIVVSGGHELMNSRMHGSEDALGSLPCRSFRSKARARMLIGGLGMGFTLAAALHELASDAQITVAELVPEVVDWNRGPLGEKSGYPLSDPRAKVVIGDVADVMRRSPGTYDIIALDVDNGPEGLTSEVNDRLYSLNGITIAQQALAPGGVLAYWSASADRRFRDRLRKSGLKVEEVTVRAFKNRGPRHTLWLAR